VREVLSFDDFARCEFQMEVLLRSVGRCLPAENRSGLERLINVARRQARDRLAASMKLLANHVAAIARDRQVVASDDKSLTQRIQGSLRGSQDDPRRSEAIADLAARTNAAITQATDELLALYGQSKSSSTWLAPPTSNEHQLVVPTNRVKAAALGGVVSGAMSGLMADLATGGLTLGAGMVVGAVVGALGGSGVAQTRDSMRGIDRATVAWGSEFMDRVVRDALLRYLTVLHMGRGKDEELQEQDRQKWTDCIERSFEHDARQYQALWKRAGKLAEDALLVSEIAGLMQSTATHTIAALYPEIADGLYFGDTRRPPA
jgi:hypothetical protein